MTTRFRRVIRIEYLLDHLEAIPTLARWHEQEWTSRTLGMSFEERVRRLQERVGRRQIPTVVVALLDENVVGFACLEEHDMSTRLDLSPWLASVLVAPLCRGGGIGTALSERIVEEARALGVPDLFLYTYDKQPFYARLGWTVLERVEYRGEDVTIMRRNLAPWLSHRPSHERTTPREMTYTLARRR